MARTVCYHFATELPDTYLFQSTPTETVDAINPCKLDLTCINGYCLRRKQPNSKTGGRRFEPCHSATHKISVFRRKINRSSKQLEEISHTYNVKRLGNSRRGEPRNGAPDVQSACRLPQVRSAAQEWHLAAVTAPATSGHTASALALVLACRPAHEGWPIHSPKGLRPMGYRPC